MKTQIAFKYDRSGIDVKQLVDIYRNVLKTRRIEEKMLLLLRQGKISKWFGGIGQEGIAVGATMALQEDEYILPMHRNLGVFTTRKIPLEKLFKQLQGKKGGFTNGRDRSFHFGTNDFHIVGMISHLGPQLAVADGIALANKLDSSPKATLVFTGEGGTSEGDFHEALNVASVWKLPVIFIVENNGYGLSTPVSEQYNCEKISDRAIGYGMKSCTVEGNNVLEVFKTIFEISAQIRKNPEPHLVECMTFRMLGHEEASGVKYVPQHLFEEWEKKDPVVNYEQFLLDENLITENQVIDIKHQIDEEIESGLKAASDEEELIADTKTESQAIFRQHTFLERKPSTTTKKKMRLVDAVSDGLRMAMESHEDLVIMGQDIAEYGGVFKITDGFIDQFGKERVRNTPICESAILGAGLGLSIAGKKSVIEMQFADFVTSGFNQVVNNLAKSHYRWGQTADVVVRMPTGAGVAAGPFHSQSNEAWFFHTPGLKIVYPATPSDTKGLLLAAIDDPKHGYVF